MNETETLRILNQRFKSACRIMLKREIGDVWEYDGWLSGMMDVNRRENSSVSGKEVVLGIKEYAKDARFISHDEVDYGGKYPSIALEGAKSLESVARACAPIFIYCGNLTIGNCNNIEKSTNLSDCHFAYDSAQYGDSKYLYKCTVGRESEDLFGVHGPGESQMCIRCTQTYKEKRCLECWMCQNVSDCYYSFNLQNCTDCMFCFNLKNKRYCIGNAQLSKDEYANAKSRLLSQMAETLKSRKSIPSLMEIVSKAKKSPPKIPALPESDTSGGKESIEKEFTKTAKLVLGTELFGIDDYSDWLQAHTHTAVKLKSAASGKPILFLPFAVAISGIQPDRVVTFEEAAWLGENSSIPKENALLLTLDNVHEFIGGIAYHNVDFREGKNTNVTENTLTIDCSYTYRSLAQVYSKYCACGMWPRTCEHVFGFDTIWSSSFCIKCYHSVNLTRCFECDSCHSCSDSYFCHNSENLRDCMFCFNVKNLKYAIGNVELPREDYLRIKKLVLEEIAQKLEKDKKLDLSIYNIGARK